MFLSTLQLTFAALAEDITNDMPVFGANQKGERDDSADSVIGKLAALSLRRYPLVTRRHDFFASRQLAGETFPDFVAHVHKLATLADLDSLQTNELRAFHLMTDTNDETLRKKFLELERATLDNVKRICNAHYSARFHERHVSSATAKYMGAKNIAHASSCCSGWRKNIRLAHIGGRRHQTRQRVWRCDGVERHDRRNDDAGQRVRQGQRPRITQFEGRRCAHINALSGAAEISRLHPI